MKEKNAILALFLVLVAFTTQAQTSTPDFFAGKWEITVVGTPQGDAKMVADLTRNNGILSGNLVNQADTTNKIPVTVEEKGNKIALFFNSQNYDVTIDLEKVDDDNLKGNLLNMFDASAKRLK
jgi:hypothetical protein